MQAVILAAGQSSRFYPFNTEHKSCIKIAGKTIIQHTLESVKNTGITDVVIVVSPDSSIPSLVGDGSSFGLNISYITQENPNGAGDALLAAKTAISGDFFVLNANRVEFEHFYKGMVGKKKDTDSAVLLCKKEVALQSFGCVKTEGEKVTDIIEKPAKGEEPSDLKIVGVYLLPRSFLQILEGVEQEHYSLEDRKSVV